MKKKNLFILIGGLFIIGILIIIWWLNNLQKELNENHIGLTFEIHNCRGVEMDNEALKMDFLKPLLKYTMIEENGGLQTLYIPQISCDDIKFSIPAIGINTIRYNADATNLKESTMTSDARDADERTFFSNWEAKGFLDLENKLLKGHSQHKKNEGLVSIWEIMESEQSDKIPDSYIIDKNCSDEILNKYKPFIFRNTTDLRAFLDEQIKINNKSFEKYVIDGKIKLFVWCGEYAYLNNPNDQDNDGVPNEIDKCPKISGDKSNNGCPIVADSDRDGVPDDQDQCPNESGQKECAGCICKKDPGCKSDRDQDGICDDIDKCPNEYGFKRYNGCPIPNCDNDELNDEQDKCKCEKGPASNDGCPVTIRITHNNEDGKFIVGGSGFDFSKYRVYMKIKQSASGPAKGAILTHEFTHNVCPFSTANDHFEATKLIKALKDPSNLTVTIYVDDKNGNNIKTTEFKNLSMICFAGIDADCGFVDLDKTN
jgi:hypothetical protein